MENHLTAVTHLISFVAYWVIYRLKKEPMYQTRLLLQILGTGLLAVKMTARHGWFILSYESILMIRTIYLEEIVKNINYVKDHVDHILMSEETNIKAKSTER